MPLRIKALHKLQLDADLKGVIMKKIKKLIAMTLAAVSCLALSVPCFASSGPARNAVRLRVGESYTIGDTTITIKRDERMPEQRAAERKALLAELISRAQIGDKYYYVKAVEYNSANPWDQTFNCKRTRGDTLRFDIDNYASGIDTILQLYEDEWDNPVEAYIEAGTGTYAEVHTNNSSGLADQVQMSIYGTGGKMWFALSVYQYWW